MHADSGVCGRAAVTSANEVAALLPSWCLLCLLHLNKIFRKSGMPLFDCAFLLASGIVAKPCSSGAEADPRWSAGLFATDTGAVAIGPPIAPSVRGSRRCADTASAGDACNSMWWFRHSRPPREGAHAMATERFDLRAHFAHTTSASAGATAAAAALGKVINRLPLRARWSIAPKRKSRKICR